MVNDIFDSSDRDPEELGEGKDLTIDLAGFTLGRGRGGMGYDSGRLFVIEGVTVTIKNGEMGGGNEDEGGVIYMSSGKLTLDSVNIYQGYSDDKGGAIYIKGGELYMTGGSLIESWSGGDASGVYVTDDAYVKFDGVTFDDNSTAEGKGGAVYVDSAREVVIENCTFMGNAASGNGGAVYIDGGDYQVTIAHTKFSGNHSYENGGAIHFEGGSGSVQSCIFVDNNSDIDGGAICCADGAKVTVSGQDSDLCTFSQNSSWKSGGAIRVKGGELTLTNATFERNRAQEHGAGLYINNDAVVQLENVSFTGNVATQQAGGILIGEDDNLISFKGKIVVKDNSAGTGNNVYVRTDGIIDCFGMADDSYIGVSFERYDRVFTNSFKTYNEGKDPGQFFKSDNADYYVAADPDSQEAKIFSQVTGGDMSDNTTWIIVGVVIALIVVALLALFIIRRNH